jgi:hypothetical protein
MSTEQMKRHVPQVITAAVIAICLLAGYGAMELANADGVELAVQDAEVDAGQAPPPAVTDPESDLAGFVRIMIDMAKTSWPGFAVFLALAAVSVARKRMKKAREGTTGIATATALAFLTVVAASIAMGVPIGQALGGGLVALLTGRAFATSVQPAKVQ